MSTNKAGDHRGQAMIMILPRQLDATPELPVWNLESGVVVEAAEILEVPSYPGLRDLKAWANGQSHIAAAVVVESDPLSCSLECRIPHGPERR